MQTDLPYAVIFLICNFFSLIAIHKYYRVFFEKFRCPTWQIIGAYGLHFVLNSVAYLILNIPLITMLCSMGTYYLILLLYDGKFWKQIAAFAFVCAFQILTDALCYICSMYLPLEMTKPLDYPPAISHVLYALFNYIAALLVNQLKSIRKQVLPGMFQVISSVIVCGISFYLTIVIWGIENISQSTRILCISGILVINILMFTLYDFLAASYIRNMQLALHEQEKAYYQHQCELMLTSQNEMSAFRHDIRNHLTVLTDLIAKHNDTEVLHYLDTLIKETHFRGNYSKSGNVSIDSIINYKLRYAEEQNISVSAEIAVPDQLAIDTADIATILGNLLDNALDALQQAKQRELQLKIIYTKGRLIIFTHNSYNGKVLYQNGHLQSIKGSGHGFGLRNVQSALEKYNGSISVRHDMSYFTVNAMLYMPESTMQG